MITIERYILLYLYHCNSDESHLGPLAVRSFLLNQSANLLFIDDDGGVHGGDVHGGDADGDDDGDGDVDDDADDSGE